MWIEYYEQGEKARKIFGIKSLAGESGQIFCDFNDMNEKLILRVDGASGYTDRIIVSYSKKNTNTIVV